MFWIKRLKELRKEIAAAEEYLEKVNREIQYAKNDLKRIKEAEDEVKQRIWWLRYADENNPMVLVNERYDFACKVYAAVHERIARSN